VAHSALRAADDGEGSPFPVAAEVYARADAQPSGATPFGRSRQPLETIKEKATEFTNLRPYE
jgi:hypothetical protein